MSNIQVYTAIVGEKYPIRREDDIPCFGDEEIFKNPIMEAKRYKVLHHLFYPDANITIWMDGNISTNLTPQQLVDKYLADSDMAVFKHPDRQCAYQEFNVLIRQDRFQVGGKSDLGFNWYLQSQLKKQQDYYLSQGFPQGFGLWECNFVIRRNVPKVNNLMQAWWAEICRWQWRDQVSFPYVLWKNQDGIKLNTISEGNIRRNENFSYRWHY